MEAVLTDSLQQANGAVYLAFINTDMQISDMMSDCDNSDYPPMAWILNSDTKLLMVKRQNDDSKMISLYTEYIFLSL